MSPRVLKSCAPSLCGPLTGLFQRIIHQGVFPASWKISQITPIYKKGSQSDPMNYRPIAVLPTLSRVFECVLVPQLYKRIIQHIPSEQFGFVKGSNTLDAGLSLASTIMSALNQRAEVRLVALDIKGAFDHVCWKGFLAHLWSFGFREKVIHLFESYLSDQHIKVVTSVDSSELFHLCRST